MLGCARKKILSRSNNRPGVYHLGLAGVNTFSKNFFPWQAQGVAKYDTPPREGLTWGAGCGLIYTLNREAHAVELQIIMTILIVLASGIAGGIFFTYFFELDSRNRQRRARIKRIKERAKMRKITTKNA